MNTLLAVGIAGMMVCAAESERTPYLRKLTDGNLVLVLTKEAVSGSYLSSVSGTVSLANEKGEPILRDATPAVLVDAPEFTRMKQENETLRQQLRDSVLKRYQSLKDNNDKAAENGRLRDLLSRVFTAKTLEEAKEEIQAILLLGNQVQKDASNGGGKGIDQQN